MAWFVINIFSKPKAMYFMYVDESGDPGTHVNSSKHFILSGLVFHQDNWEEYLDRLKKFRKQLKTTYGLNQRTEIHSAELIRPRNNFEYQKIKKSERIDILKEYCKNIPIIFDSAVIINICLNIDEHNSSDIFNLAWSRLLDRYNTFLSKDCNDKGIIVNDDTSSNKLMTLQRKLRVHNPVPGIKRNAPLSNLIEDPFSRQSHHSYFIQTVDVISHCLYRHEFPKGSLKKFNLEKSFLHLEPILLKKASRTDPYGIVRK